MPQRLRRLMAWLLLLALPWQALAAATASQAVAVVTSQAAMSEDCAHAHAQPLAAAPCDADPAHASHGGGTTSDTCSQCAQGCVAGALIPACRWTPERGVPEVPPQAWQAPTFGFITGAPERPPRPSRF